MSTLLIIHSIFRWLAAIAALALIIRLAAGLARRQAFDRTAAALSSAFSGLMDTQMLLGLLLFILGGVAGIGFPAYRVEHALIMLSAVVVSHLPAIWKKAGDPARTRNTLLAVLSSALLIFLGVGPLGWTRWLHITGLF